MDKLTSEEVLVLFLGLGTLLATARVLGELAKRFNQPAVLGEILAGVLLGPTVLGTLAPGIIAYLFPPTGGSALALDGLTSLAIALFLLVAGIEVDLSTMWRQGRAAMLIGVAGIVFPFALGFILAWSFPSLLGRTPGADRLIFALFIATALSISALPVIARTLMDLALYRSDFGMVVIAAAVCNDLFGWIIFAVILSMMGSTVSHSMGLGLTIGLTLGFAAFMLTIGRWLIHRVLPWVQAHTSWPGGVLGFALTLALFGAAFTEWIGVHAIFGAFLVGVAIGDSPHLREHTRTIINDFVSFIFAPLFFASIGLRVNFAANFDLSLILVVLAVACAGKIIGCSLGARLAGMAQAESWAAGFGMNARGAMEIILGLLALQYRVVDERVFVALVVMALATSIMSGPAIYRILELRKPRRLSHFLSPKSFLKPLIANSREEAIRALSEAVSAAAGLDASAVEQAVLEREQIMPTGIGNGVAIPHARLTGLTSPVVGFGLSPTGVDFDAPDGEPAHLVFLILTPRDDDGAQLEILADIARTFKEETNRQAVLRVDNYTQFLALLRTGTNG